MTVVLRPGTGIEYRGTAILLSMRRPADWLRQAELDLVAARDIAASEHFEWACFLAHQSAEKAVKALHESEGTEAWGHSVVGLLGAIAGVPEEIADAAKVLDRHYIPTRYPTRTRKAPPVTSTRLETQTRRSPTGR